MHTGQNIFVNTVYSAVNKYSWRTRRMRVALTVPLDKMRTRRSAGIWSMAKNGKKPTETCHANVLPNGKGRVEVDETNAT